MTFKPTQLISALLPAMAISHAAFAFEQHEAHEHGAGYLNMAVEGKQVSAEMRFPMKDIVGFEHAPASEKEHAAIDAAAALLNKGNLVLLTSAAECSLTESHVSLEEGEHDEHAHEEHDHGHEKHEEHGHKDHDHGHEKHDDHGHEKHHDHGHEKHDHHKEHAHEEHHDHHKDEHDKHDHEEHAHKHDEHKHDEHDHDGHNEEHSDVDIHYSWTCAHPEKLSSVELALFKQFPTIESVQTSVITSQGAKSKSLTPANNKIDLR